MREMAAPNHQVRTCDTGDRSVPSPTKEGFNPLHPLFEVGHYFIERQQKMSTVKQDSFIMISDLDQLQNLRLTQFLV